MRTTAGILVSGIAGALVFGFACAVEDAQSETDENRQSTTVAKEAPATGDKVRVYIVNASGGG